MRILVIEDDARIASNLADMLTTQSYAVDTASTGANGLQKARDESYDLLLVDWKLPDISGPDVIKLLRQEEVSTPILMLTAKTQAEDVVFGLNSGADDYLTKPFQMSELFARVRALLRRAPASPLPPILRLADLSIDINLRQVSRAGRSISLSPKEYALLEYLARTPNVAISRLDLLSHVWDENADPFSNTVDVHIRYLRQKIDAGHSLPLIRTVKGQGYALCDSRP